MGEALLKQEYFSIIELQIRGTVDTLLKEIENYLTSETATNNVNKEISVHTGTTNTDESHAGLVQSTCLEKSMYKTVLCKHGEVNVQNPW